MDFFEKGGTQNSEEVFRHLHQSLGRTLHKRFPERYVDLYRMKMMTNEYLTDFFSKEAELFKTFINSRDAKVSKIIITQDDTTNSGHVVFIVTPGIPPAPDLAYTSQKSEEEDDEASLVSQETETATDIDPYAYEDDLEEDLDLDWYDTLAESEDDFTTVMSSSPPHQEDYTEEFICIESLYLTLEDFPRVLYIDWETLKNDWSMNVHSRVCADMSRLELIDSAITADLLLAYARIEFLDLFIFGWEEGYSKEVRVVDKWRGLFVVTREETDDICVSTTRSFPECIMKETGSVRSPKKNHLAAILDTLKKFYWLEYEEFLYYANNFPTFPLYSMARQSFRNSVKTFETLISAKIYAPHGRRMRGLEKAFNSDLAYELNDKDERAFEAMEIMD